MNTADNLRDLLAQRYRVRTTASATPPAPTSPIRLPKLQLLQTEQQWFPSGQAAQILHGSQNSEQICNS